MRRFIALVTGTAIVGAINLVGPPNHVATAAAATVSPATNWPAPKRPPLRRLTPAVKHEAAVALAIRNHAQHGRTFDSRQAWSITQRRIPALVDGGSASTPATTPVWRS